APEIIFPMCHMDGKDDLRQAVETLAADGYRVLALARGMVTDKSEDALHNLDCLGLVALIDPLRETARAAVHKCRKAGVTVRMITGDHPLTALSIARNLDMAEGADDVVSGSTLSALANDQTAFDAVVSRARVFARISPMQKLDIVQSMQRAGHVVAVTGDGVNDASALAAADIGAAMGRSGTDVAREAADLIVTDDDLMSIAAGIEEGRIAYDNVRKVIYLLISTGAAEIMLFVAAISTGLPLPLTPVQLLWLNLVSQGIQDVTLAFEKGEPDVLSRQPRRPGEGIFDRVMIEQVLLSGAIVGGAGFALFSITLAMGWSTFDASNMLLLMIILFENAHVFNCRSETRSAFKVPFASNPYLIAGVISAQGLHIGAMYTPGLSDVLDIAPVSLNAWLMAAGSALSIIMVMNVYKMVLRRRSGQTG
ncbi:MAG: HAD-IC family P-type ATPase, partial [Sphingomonadales bacterium]|nr:HAD-IC family P-type ATPase [Sphingomonadales bacterium]